MADLLADRSANFWPVPSSHALEPESNEMVKRVDRPLVNNAREQDVSLKALSCCAEVLPLHHEFFRSGRAEARWRASLVVAAFIAKRAKHAIGVDESGMPKKCPGISFSFQR